MADVADGLEELVEGSIGFRSGEYWGGDQPRRGQAVMTQPGDERPGPPFAERRARSVTPTGPSIAFDHACKPNGRNGLPTNPLTMAACIHVAGHSRDSGPTSRSRTNGKATLSD